MTKRLSLLASPTALGRALDVRGLGGSARAKGTPSASARNSARQAINIFGVVKANSIFGHNGSITSTGSESGIATFSVKGLRK
jgi:hypothetical protein